MRGFATVILFLFFIITFQLTVFTYAFQSTLTANYLKERLRESGIYPLVAKEVPNLLIEEENGVHVPEKTKKEVESFLEKEITAGYLQNKLEVFVDDIFSWLAGKSNEAPTLSFADIKEKMDGMVASHVLSEEIEEFISKPIKLDPPAAPNLRQWFQLLQIAPIAFGSVSIAFLAAIFWVARGWRSKLRKTSLALFIPAVLGVMGTVIFFFGGNLAVGLSTGALEGPQLGQFAQPLNEAFNETPTNLAVKMFVPFATALALSATLFVASFFVERKSKEKLIAS